MIMTENVITLNQDDSLETAERLFKKHKIRHLPVVYERTIVGMLSQTDLLRISFADVVEDGNESIDLAIYNMFTIKQIMVKNFVSVSSSNSIKQVAKIFATREFHALPVVDNNKLVGIVTTTDLIRYLLEQL